MLEENVGEYVSLRERESKYTGKDEIRSHWYFSTSTPAFFIAFTDCFDI